MRPDTEFDGEVDGIVDRLAAGPTSAYAATKRALNITTLGALEDALACEHEEQSRLVGTADFVEGVRAGREAVATALSGI